MSNDLKIAVVSDLHTHDGSSAELGAPSMLGTSDPEDQPKRHPISGLKKLISDNKLRADILLCSGDLANKATPSGLNYAWRQLEILKNALGARKLIATAGNHDMDSRYQDNE
jgi:metallophosphoesterase superfamily enzyme